METYLLPRTGVETHHHPVHERDIELSGEVEDALKEDEWRALGTGGGATAYLHGGNTID